MYLAQCNFYAAHILQRTRLLYLVYMRTMQSQTRCDSLVCCLCFIFVLFFYFEFILGFGMKESTANLHSVLRLYCFKDQCATRHSVAIQWKIKSMMIAIIKFIVADVYFLCEFRAIRFQPHTQIEPNMIILQWQEEKSYAEVRTDCQLMMNHFISAFFIICNQPELLEREKCRLFIAT